LGVAVQSKEMGRLVSTLLPEAEGWSEQGSEPWGGRSNASFLRIHSHGDKAIPRSHGRRKNSWHAWCMLCASARNITGLGEPRSRYPRCLVGQLLILHMLRVSFFIMGCMHAQVENERPWCLTQACSQPALESEDKGHAIGLT
jgi:hypothetical protein